MTRLALASLLLPLPLLAPTPDVRAQASSPRPVRIVGTAEMRDNPARQGAEVRTSSPEEFATFVRADMTRWAKVVKDANVKVE